MMSFTVTLENNGDANGTHMVSLSAADAGNESTSVDVSADETRNVSLSMVFDESGAYDVEVGDESFTIQVEEGETETEIETDASGGAEGADNDDDTIGASGPGFGVLSVLVATMIGVGVLRSWE